MIFTLTPRDVTRGLRTSGTEPSESRRTTRDKDGEGGARAGLAKKRFEQKEEAKEERQEEQPRRRRRQRRRGLKRGLKGRCERGRDAEECYNSLQIGEADVQSLT